MSEEGGGSGVYGAFASKLGSGAAKIGKRAAQSEAGRSATRAAVKGATDAAVKDVSDRYLGGTGEAPPPSATPTQSSKTSSTTKSTSAPPTQTSAPPTHRYHDNDSDEEFEEFQRKAQYLPPKPSKLNRFKPVINFSKSKEKVNTPSRGGAPTRTKPKDKIYKYSLAREADWSSQKAVALYNFKGIMNCDLEFCKGQRLEILTRTENSFDWWEGRINDRVGIFPANYVKIV